MPRVPRVAAADNLDAVVDAAVAVVDALPALGTAYVSLFQIVYTQN